MICWSRTILYGLYSGGLLLLWALSGSKYGWMQQMDNQVATEAIEAASDNRALVRFLLLIAVSGPQLVVAFRTNRRSMKGISVALAAVAVGVWLLTRG